MSRPSGQDSLQELQRLHTEVDSRVNDIEARQNPPLNCRRGCSDCCIDDLTVFAVEADLIRRDHADLLAGSRPHTEGACAFLDAAGACRIYPSRPYVCRTQGLPLRWEEEDAESRDLCPLNLADLVGGRADLAVLPPDLCWSLGPYESRLAGIQLRAQGGLFTEDLPRRFLRSLFEKS